MIGADLTATDLASAALSSANLTGADLTATDLANAALSNASLAGADLSWANLGGANLSGATLTGVIWDTTTCPDGTVSTTNGSSPESCIGHL